MVVSAAASMMVSFLAAASMMVSVSMVLTTPAHTRVLSTSSLVIPSIVLVYILTTPQFFLMLSSLATPAHTRVLSTSSLVIPSIVLVYILTTPQFFLMLSSLAVTDLKT